MFNGDCIIINKISISSPNFKYNSNDTEEKSPVTFEFNGSTVKLDYSIRELVEDALVPVG